MNNYLQSEIQNTCFGCEACVQICPEKCITLKVTCNGFWYPIIDGEKCTDCDLCKKVCPYEKIESILKERITKSYAARTKDNAVLQQSTSGGIFTELSMPIFDKGGVVFGAVLTDDFIVVHQAAQHINQLEKMRGSKYVQSRIGETYKETEAYLKKGIQVLFSGTPCQIAGLRTYLGKGWDNLTTVDVICHGVLAPDVAVYHVKALEREFVLRRCR